MPALAAKPLNRSTKKHIIRIFLVVFSMVSLAVKVMNRDDNKNVKPRRRIYLIPG
jgi:hypothetical protein